MKKRILLLLLSTALLLFPVSCGKEKYDLLYETANGTLTYCVRGSGERARQLVVKEGDKVLWNEKVDVDKAVGSLGGTYGFEAVDLNFDGAVDVMIADSVSGDCVSKLCFLYDAESGAYVLSEVLDPLYNLKADPERQALLAFSQTIVREDGGTTTTDATTQYVWKNGVLTPKMRISLSYYSENNVYCSSVAYYNEATGKFEEDYEKEHWYFSEAERQAQDFSGLYYFK